MVRVPWDCWAGLPDVRAASTLFVIWNRRDVGFSWTLIPLSPFTSASARVAFSRAVMSQLPQEEAFVGDVELLDGHLARLGIELRARHLCRQSAPEGPGRDDVVRDAQDADDPVVALLAPGPRDDPLDPLPERPVHARAGAPQHPPLEHDVLVLGPPDPADDAVVAATLQVLLDVHLDVEAGALLERPGAQLRARGRCVGWRRLRLAQLGIRALDELHLEAERAEQAEVSHGPPPRSGSRRRSG